MSVCVCVSVSVCVCVCVCECVPGTSLHLDGTDSSLAPESSGSRSPGTAKDTPPSVPSQPRAFCWGPKWYFGAPTRAACSGSWETQTTVAPEAATVSSTCGGEFTIGTGVC